MTSLSNEEALINLVKNKRFLWDPKDPEYKNISLKTEEFENIGRNFNLTGDEVRRKWRSLRSGFRRELLARSNKKSKPKTKQWKHFNKLLFLRDSENALSDNEFDDNQQNSMCVNQSDNVSTDDFSDLMQLNSPVPNLVESMVENGEIKLNLITNDKQDKCSDTQIKIIQPNLTHNPTTLQPQQIYFVKANGMSDISNLLVIKKSDQTTTATTTTTQLNQLNQIHQINQEEEYHHHHHTDQQSTPKAITTTTPTNHRTNDHLIINSFKTNNTNVQAPKAKKRKDDSDDDLSADDYFGRMIASLIKEFDQEERKTIRLAILQLITDWSKKKNHENAS